MNHRIRKYENCPIAVVGESSTASEIIFCLIRAGHRVYGKIDPTVITGLATQDDGHDMTDRVEGRYGSLKGEESIRQADLVVIITKEDLDLKKEEIQNIEGQIDSDTLIVVNSESYTLEALHEGTKCPHRIMGLNWVRPAHHTFFAELITLPVNNLEMVNGLMELVRDHWGKDPYVLKKGRSIRSRLLAALVREALYLVEGGYVEEEDIDRACRNDPGYYLPFAGNCRYMDLMGTYLYGVVMKDLNPELSKMTELPTSFLKVLKEEGVRGMEHSKGIYKYESDQIQEQENSFLKFSKEIKKIMMRYPFPGK